MSEASRQRWLFLHNRLEELAAKHGPPPEVEVPDWLDHYPEPGDQLPPNWGPQDATVQPQEPLELAPGEEWVADVRWPPSEPPRASRRVLGPAAAMQHIDRHHESPLFACPVCGEESAKANVAIDLWHCTACERSGSASSLRPPDEGPTTVHVV